MKHLLKESEWLETQLGQYSAINLEFKTTFLGSSLRKFPHIGADSHAVYSKLVIVVVNQRAKSTCCRQRLSNPLNSYWPLLEQDMQLLMNRKSQIAIALYRQDTVLTA